MPATLQLPHVDYRDSFIEATREFQAEGLRLELDIPGLERDFGDFVLKMLARRTDPIPGYVPETVYWLIAEDERTFIGRLSLRHDLTQSLRYLGGHIGYEIRPTWRQRGYGKLICHLGLEKARLLGLPRVLITCDADNDASRKIIEANGGEYEGSDFIYRRDVPVLRYWVTL